MPNQLDRERSSRIRGFSLIELVMVMVVVAVLGVVVLARYHEPSATAVSIEADHVARDIRHMQMLAMTWGQTLRFTPAGSGYFVRCASGSTTLPCNGGSPVTDPADGLAFSRSLGAGSVSGISFTVGASFDFDALGRPGTWSAGPTFTLSSAAASFTVAGGSETSTVAVAPLTGFVTVGY